jgi:hypothetical protein
MRTPPATSPTASRGRSAPKSKSGGNRTGLCNVISGMEWATSVDPDALRAAAQRLDSAADLLHAVLAFHLNGLSATEPRLRAAVDQLKADLGRWQRTATETAAALRTAAHRYCDTEEHAVQVLR